jgi:lipid-A-disaccharide synthase-like uncharacterized protein
LNDLVALAPVLALQVWDGFGWAGQAVFTWRILHQWLASEKAKRSVVPPSFWAWSLLGSALRVVYDAYRRDPVYLLGDLVNGSIYGRNAWMSRPAAVARRGARTAVWPVFLGLAIFVGVAVESLGPDHGFVRFDYTLPWMLAGFVGTLLWTSRFVIQWWESERKGHSHLPASFFWISIVGSVLLFAYAVFRRDWVNMASYALNPVPYARNLVLMARHKAAPGAG